MIVIIAFQFNEFVVEAFESIECNFKSLSFELKFEWIEFKTTRITSKSSIFMSVY